jgi:hypothetical protein
VLADELGHTLQVFGRGDEESQPVHGVELGDELLEECRVTIVMDVRVYQLGSSSLRQE